MEEGRRVGEKKAGERNSHVCEVAKFFTFVITIVMMTMMMIIFIIALIIIIFHRFIRVTALSFPLFFPYLLLPISLRLMSMKQPGSPLL